MARRGALTADARRSMIKLTVTVRPEGALIAGVPLRLNRTSRAPVVGSTRGSIWMTAASIARCCPDKLTRASVPARISVA